MKGGGDLTGPGQRNKVYFSIRKSDHSNGQPNQGSPPQEKEEALGNA